MATKNMKIAIIGAGASGMMALIKLREAGITDVTVFEKAETLGGTWRDNRYPGLTCDVPSMAYRYSFAPNAEWTHVCAPGPEILDYLKDIAAEYDLESDIKYSCEVLKADFADGQWRIETNAGDEGAFDVVLAAAGVLHHPALPDIPGLDTFAGDAFHTARWPHDFSLKGKRIGLIGTGSTATQITGAIIDVLVLATGFDAHKIMSPMVITGRNGKRLDAAWADAQEAYLAVTIPDFPNWFMIGGPNSPVGNFSWLQTAELQFGYALQLIELIRNGNAREIAPKPEALRRFNDAVIAKMPDTVWASGCKSWYINKDGHVASWPWTFEKFEADMSKPKLDDYEIA